MAQSETLIRVRNIEIDSADLAISLSASFLVAGLYIAFFNRLTADADLETLDPLWQVDFGERVTSPVVAEGRAIVALACMSNHLLAA